MIRRCNKCLQMRDLKPGRHLCAECKAESVARNRARNGYTGRPRHWATKGPCPHCAGLEHRVPRGTTCICGTKHKAEPKVHAVEFLQFRRDVG
jgi:hypothetical protein